MRHAMVIMSWLAVAGVVLVSAPAAGFESSLEEMALLLPAADSIPGWAPDREAESYDAENLWEYIDGSADLFLVYDFQRVLVQSYLSQERQGLTVEIYELSSPLSAFGIYSQRRSPGLDSYDIGAGAFGDEYTINFWKNRFYVRVAIFEKSAELLAEAQRFASAIAGNIAEGGALPPELVNLTKWGFRAEDITYVPKGALGRERFPAAFVASCEDRGEKGTLYLFALADSATARELFDWYAGETSTSVTSGGSSIGPVAFGTGKDPYQGDIAAVQYRRWVMVVTGFKAGTNRARNLALQTTGMLHALK